MTVDVLTEVEIARPRSEVAAYAADVDNTTEWYANIKAVVWETPRPLEVGSRIAFVAEFLGRRLSYTYVVREHVIGQRLVMSTDEGLLPMETTYTWSDAGEHTTRMTLRNRGGPVGLRQRIAAPLLARSIRRANQKDLARLKQVIESTFERPSPPP